MLKHLYHFFFVNWSTKHFKTFYDAQIIKVKRYSGLVLSSVIAKLRSAIVLNLRKCAWVLFQYFKIQKTVIFIKMFIKFWNSCFCFTADVIVSVNPSGTKKKTSGRELVKNVWIRESVQLWENCQSRWTFQWVKKSSMRLVL